MSRYQQLLEMIQDPGADCIKWPYGKTGRGYGVIWRGGKARRAHRIVLQLTNPAPVGKVCSVKGHWVPGHKLEAAHGPCHNRHCVNPRHLSWLTPAENTADQMRDGTDNNGEANNLCKLTTIQVAEIRERYATGQHTQRSLAAEYGVHRGNISHVVNYRTRKVS